ncbi:unnamed protein product [Hymenolepis diminuta]|uniref:Zinc finger protein 655 n=1 Tax=Hymenolepis diminuta TaxID=6216 RepID=A0A0R3SIZ1_HYMDI|nr:unnamed protein product [Hymenolepis diminuta]
MNSHMDPSGHEEIFTDADHHRAISWDALPPHEVLFEHINPSPPPPSAVISQDEGSFQELRISPSEEVEPIYSQQIWMGQEYEGR